VGTGKKVNRTSDSWAIVTLTIIHCSLLLRSENITLSWKTVSYHLLSVRHGM
jgi:hypothetical protein